MHTHQHARAFGNITFRLILDPSTFRRPRNDDFTQPLPTQHFLPIPRRNSVLASRCLKPEINVYFRPILGKYFFGLTFFSFFLSFFFFFFFFFTASAVYYRDHDGFTMRKIRHMAGFPRIQLLCLILDSPKMTLKDFPSYTSGNFALREE